MAGNQLGKTTSGGAETAMHLTGRYPEWWGGIRFTRPVVGWAASVTGESTRDNVQRMLMGWPGQEGTGMLPAESITDKKAAAGIPNALDSVVVRHISGGYSMVGFKSYERGRQKWQGPSLDFVWFDEEPPEDIYSEGLTRTNATNGIVWVTFTPLLGWTKVVDRFIKETSPDRGHVVMTIDDVDHYSEEKKAQIVAAYSAHEREARARGEPAVGSGRVFPVLQETIEEEALERVPRHWSQVIGLDFGWDHPTAAVHLAHDRDNDVIHVLAAYRQREATPVVHAAALRVWGDWVPVAWPHDGLHHDKGSGRPLAEQYRDQGLNMLPEKATHEDGSIGVEAGVIEMLDRMQTGRLKVARHLHEWFEEFRYYHRKDGKIVADKDDLLSATRYAIMMLREATTPPYVSDRIPDSDFVYH